MLLLLRAMLPVVARASAFEQPQGYLIGPCSGTDSKPQSKLWFNDGIYGCIIDSPEGNRIFRLDGRSWVPQQTPDAILGGHDGRADVLWDGSRLVVLLWDEHQPQLFEFGYDAARREYRLEAGFPMPLAIEPGSETMVIDEDSRGLLWASYVSNKQVYVAHSETDHHVWQLPGSVVRDSLSKDDISSVIAFGAPGPPGREVGHIGVLWSDQNRDEFGFRMRNDGDPADAWGAVEVVDRGPGHADDHVHLTADAAGRVYAITKDDRHRIDAHLRAPEGGWITAADVLQGGDATRPIFQTAETDGMLVLLYTRWHEGAEIISYRTSPLGRLEFGKQLAFIAMPGVQMNDVTGTKQSLPAGNIVAVADGGGNAWWNGWGADPSGSSAAQWHLRVHALSHVSDAALALDFDEGEGDEVVGASLHLERGRLGGPWAEDACEPRWVEGVSGSALRFDGVRDFIEIDPAAQLDITGSMTVEAWVRRASHATKDAVLCKGTPGERGYQVRLLKEDVVEFLREVHAKNHVLQGRTAIGDTLWHHVACVYDEPGRQSRIYVDGNLDAAAADSGASMASATPLYIGARLGEEELRDWFHGDIDQVRITPGVRYSADFEPAASFETSGEPALFLSWTPRYAGDRQCEAYDVLRGLEGAALEKLNSAPLHDTGFLDPTPPAGRHVYEVRPLDCHAAAASERVVDWPPAPSPQRSAPQRP